ncbi:dockerin type I domain-containing protein [Paenibacillus sp. FSL H8-0079]|uniref:dockerin type I domain-containing protein n=1 Tax=Paenibacillus sp. FSL H8-0079 TaxID=2921375 RepID=UPI0030EE7F87
MDQMKLKWNSRWLSKLPVFMIIVLCAGLGAVPATADGAVTGEWSSWGKEGGGSGTGLGEFISPYDVAVDPEGNVYVVDSGNNRIQILNILTNQWTSLGQFGNALGEFSEPVSIAMDAAGNLYIADTGNNRIQKQDAQTKQWTQWGKSGGASGTNEGEFSSPYGIALDHEDNLYVSDNFNSRIQKLDLATNEWSVIGKAGQALGEFNYAYDVAIDNKGNVYVVDAGNNRIQKLDAATNTWSEWGRGERRTGSGLGEFFFPSGIAVDHRGDIYVSDVGNHRIQKLNVNTNQWSEWGKPGSSGNGLGEFDFPFGLTIDNTGNLYVADNNNNRIQKFGPPRLVNLNYEQGDHGTISAISEQVVVGENPVSVPTVTPDRGYRFIGWSADGGVTKLSTGQVLNTIVTEAVTYTAFYSKIIFGDADGDGIITPADALLLTQHIKEKITLTSEQLAGLDLNEDGEWDMTDVQLILAIYTGRER